MVESLRRVDLRLTIPAKAPFRELAVELAVKFAEYAGASQRRVAEVHKVVEAALRDSNGDQVDLEMGRADGQLIITTAPSNHRTTLPLAD